MLEITNEGILIQNVVPIYRADRIIKFVTSISVEDIGNVYHKLNYDEETQRGFIEKNLGRGKTEVQQIKSKKNIKEMKQKILTDFFDGGMLTWNVRVNSTSEWDMRERYEFNIMERTLLIKGRVSLPDSAQRHEVLFGLKDYDLSINPRQFCFPLAISFYTLPEEQNLFSEINGEGARCSRSRSLYLSNSVKSMFVKQLIEKTFLRGNVDFKTGVSHSTGLVTNFSILYNSFFDVSRGAYRDLKEEDMEKTLEWLIKFYNHLVEERPQLTKLTIEQRKDCVKTSLVGSKCAWIGYAQLSRMLKGNRMWKQKLGMLNSPYKSGLWEGDLLSIENPLWHGTVCILSTQEEWRVVNSKRCAQFVAETMKKHLNLTTI